jgi:T-complex protein 1 subunit zeta
VRRRGGRRHASRLTRRVPPSGPDGQPDRELCVCVARTALRTKLAAELADQLTDIVVDAVACVRREGTPLDLHMVEIMAMKHRLESDTRLVRGLVLDHGARHPDMPKHVDDAFVLTCNLSLEYEKSEVNSSFMYSSAEQRERMVSAERAYTDDRVAAVIALKRRVCAGDDAGKGFVFITQKGIDPPALDALAKEGILALRRAKRRNMERLVLACGGVAVDSVTELEPSCLGYAGRVYEHVLGDDAFTFVEEPRHPTSCTVLLKGPSDHALAQMRDAVRDGLRAVKNVYDDGCLLPGAGAFEVALAQRLLNETRRTVPGRAKLGVQAFAEALLVIPKTLAENAGLDVQEAVLALQDAYDAAPGAPVGLDVATGEPLDPVLAGIYDNSAVKVQMLHSAPVIATQLLLVDEVMRAGVNMRK